MVKKFLNKKSKRVPARRRYKIEKKVRDHNRKLKRQAKKDGTKKRTKKDIHIPNKFPLKEQVLQEAAERKRRAEELKQKQKEDRHKKMNENRTLEDVKESAEKRTEKFEKKAQNRPKQQPTTKEISRKTYYKEFKKVVDLADVVLEVLDARDPLGSRCPQLEEAVINSGANKKLVLILNKIDLIPKSNLIDWLKYLRNEFPTLAFKASTQTQKKHLCQKRKSIAHVDEKLAQSSGCLGANLLMKLLGNYGRTQDMKTSISVGVVGFPNVGKSSIINSLKRNKVCNVGATAGITKSMQEIQLDKHVKLIDSPGVILAKSDSNLSVLKNAIKAEDLLDPVSAVDQILKRIRHEDLILRYNLPQFKTTHEFLALFAKHYGKMKRGGTLDVERAARRLIQDWNTGKIKYFTHPPEAHQMPHYVSMEIIKEMSEPFNVGETELFAGLKGLPTSIQHAVQSKSMGLTDCIDDAVMEIEDKEADDSALASEKTEEISDKKSIEVSATKKNLHALKEDESLPKSLRKKAKQLDAASNLEGNQKLNKAAQVLTKKMKKLKKRNNKKANQLTEIFDSALSLTANSKDENYDFKADYHES